MIKGVLIGIVFNMSGVIIYYDEYTPKLLKVNDEVYENVEYRFFKKSHALLERPDGSVYVFEYNSKMNHYIMKDLDDYPKRFERILNEQKEYEKKVQNFLKND